MSTPGVDEASADGWDLEVVHDCLLMQLVYHAQALIAVVASMIASITAQGMVKDSGCSAWA